MSGVDDEHRVEFEADGTRLNAAYAGKHERAQDLLIAGAAANARADLFEQAVARGVLNQANQRLDIALHGGESALHLLGGERRQVFQEGKFASGC